MVASPTKAPNVDQRLSIPVTPASICQETRCVYVRKMATGLEKLPNVYVANTEPLYILRNLHIVTICIDMLNVQL